jgi:hypothetical protein
VWWSGLRRRSRPRPAGDLLAQLLAHGGELRGFACDKAAIDADGRRPRASQVGTPVTGEFPSSAIKVRVRQLPDARYQRSGKGRLSAYPR